MKKRLMMALCAVLVLCLATATAHASGLLDFLKPKDTVTITVDEYERLKQYEKLDTVKQYVDMWYYQEPDEEKAMEGAIQGLLLSLEDPYTFYYPPEDWKTMWEEDEGEYAGVGLSLLGDYLEGTVTVIRAFENTPAKEAGVRKGDRLVRVDDIEVDVYSMQAAVDVMRGKVGEEVEIEVLRGEEYITFTLKRANIHINRIDSCMLENNVGYIALYEFAGESEKEFATAFTALKEQGAKSLIVDVRDNPGGWVDAARDIGDLFLDKGMLAYSEDRYGNIEKMATNDGKDDIPIVFLVNENSASSSEILSGGLQDQGRAKLVGVKTYGKGVIQSVIPLDGIDPKTSKDGFQMTIGQYYFPSGKAIHMEGIEPDVVVEYPEELVNAYYEFGDMSDIQLQKAWEEACAMIQE